MITLQAPDCCDHCAHMRYRSGNAHPWRHPEGMQRLRQTTIDNVKTRVTTGSLTSFRMPSHPAVAAFQKGRFMFMTLGKNLFLASALAASFALFGCNSTSADDADERDHGFGGTGELTYDGQVWDLAAGVCAGSEDFVSTLNFTHDEMHLVLYVQGRGSPTPGTYTVVGGITDAEQLQSGEVTMSLTDLNFNIVAATGGSITISRPSGSGLRFASESVTFEGGKTATFDATATIGCAAPQ